MSNTDLPAYRFSDSFEFLIPPEDRSAMELRRAVHRCLKQPEIRISRRKDGGHFRDSDPDSFLHSVQTELDEAERLAPQHILFRKNNGQKPDIQHEMSTESLSWDIKGVDMPEKAQTSILETYSFVHDLPAETQSQLLFPMYLENYLLGHHTRVAIYSALIADKLNEDSSLLAKAAMLHDNGKLHPAIRSTFEQKGRLNQKEQFKKIKLHTSLGALNFDQLNQVTDLSKLGNTKEIQFILEAILMHHVHYNPNSENRHRSYPEWIHPNRVDERVQIISVADTFDALTTRGYSTIQKEKGSNKGVENWIKTIEPLVERILLEEIDTLHLNDKIKDNLMESKLDIARRIAESLQTELTTKEKEQVANRAMEIIEAERGAQLNPQAVDALLSMKMIPDIQSIAMH